MGDFISCVALFREAGDWGSNTGAPVKYGICGNPTLPPDNDGKGAAAPVLQPPLRKW